MLILTDGTEYDAIARANVTPEQLSDLEEQPNRLPFLEWHDLVAAGFEARECFREMRSMISEFSDEALEEETNRLVATKAIAAEFLFFHTMHHVADEMERRRTGTAPRARLMN